MDDEEIQRLIEQQLKGIPVSTKPGEDSKAQLYKLLFTELAHDPLEIKDSNLAEIVVRQIQLKQEKSEQFYNIVVIVAISIFIAGLTYLALTLNNSSLLNPIAQFLISQKTVCLFILICFCLIQVLDKYLAKKKQAI